MLLYPGSKIHGSVTGGKIGGLFYKDSVGVAIQRMPHMRPIVYVPDTINVQLVCHTLFGVALVLMAAPVLKPGRQWLRRNEAERETDRTTGKLDASAP